MVAAAGTEHTSLGTAAQRFSHGATARQTKRKGGGGHGSHWESKPGKQGMEKYFFLDNTKAEWFWAVLVHPIAP